MLLLPRKADGKSHQPRKLRSEELAGRPGGTTRLEQWPEGDFRLFVGNIGNEVTDELLSHSFGRYPSLARAKVIRNKHTNKSKGYAFISFMDPFDCAKALREMRASTSKSALQAPEVDLERAHFSEVRKKDKKKRKAQFAGDLGVKCSS